MPAVAADWLGQGECGALGNKSLPAPSFKPNDPFLLALAHSHPTPDTTPPSPPPPSPSPPPPPSGSLPRFPGSFRIVDPATGSPLREDGTKVASGRLEVLMRGLGQVQAGEEPTWGTVCAAGDLPVELAKVGKGGLEGRRQG